MKWAEDDGAKGTDVGVDRIVTERLAGTCTVARDVVLAIGDWKNNAELMLSVRDLGYLDDDHDVWDATVEAGKFWKLWRPAKLIATDLNPEFTDPAYGPIDATATPWADRQWHHVVFDPPYKLNGTPSAPDVPYGVADGATNGARLSLLEAGVRECARVLGDGYLLVKCQDMVAGGRVRWQTDIATRAAEAAGLRKIDALLFRSYRPQDPERGQQHARRNYSTLLVFTRNGRK